MLIQVGLPFPVVALRQPMAWQVGRDQDCSQNDLLYNHHPSISSSVQYFACLGVVADAELQYLLKKLDRYYVVKEHCICVFAREERQGKSSAINLIDKFLRLD